MILTEESLVGKAALEVAAAMVAAARTAPKSRGRNNIELLVVEGDDIQTLQKKMIDIGEKSSQHFFARDAANLEQALAVVLIATKVASAGLTYCSLCGFPSCEGKAKTPETPCSFNTIDMGIAIGSAVSVAANHRFDNRVMYTVGMAVKELGWFGKEFTIIIAIPISATSKNPFFDRS